jgi:hypothetical protein
MTDERRRVRVIMSLIYEQNQDLDDAAYGRVLEGIKEEIETALTRLDDGAYRWNEED